MDCDWSIEAPEGQKVNFTFIALNVENEADCTYDYVEVDYERYCGNKVSNRGLVISDYGYHVDGRGSSPNITQH